LARDSAIFTVACVTALVFCAGALVLVAARATGRALPRGWSRYALEVVIVGYVLVPAAFSHLGLVCPSLGLLCAVAASDAARNVPAFAKRAPRVALAALTFLGVMAAHHVPVSAARGADGLAVAIVVATCVSKRARAALVLVPAIAGVSLIHIAISSQAPFATASPILRIAFFYGAIEAGDSMAYLVGGAFGRTPLWPRVSPKKTREGAIASLVTATLVGLGFAFADPSRSFARHAGLGLLAGVLGLAGDLATSAIKRLDETKDFATWMPHHGSALDAYDSLLLAAPLWHLWSVR